MLDLSILQNMAAMRSGVFPCTDYTCQTSKGLGAQATSAISSDEVPRCYSMSHTTTALDFTVSWQQYVLHALRKQQALACCFGVQVHLLSLISLRCWQSPYIHPLNCWEVLANNTWKKEMKEGRKQGNNNWRVCRFFLISWLCQTVQPTAHAKWHLLLKKKKKKHCMQHFVQKNCEHKPAS